MTSETGSRISPSRAPADRWENEGGNIPPEATAIDDLQVQLSQYGIVAVQLTVFDWGGFRYSNAKDAIAAAKRQTRSA